MTTVTEREEQAEVTTGPIHGRDLPPQPIGTRLTLDCPACGQPFEWVSEEGHDWPVTYCSRHCKNKRVQVLTNRRAAGDLRELPGDDIRMLLCRFCGEPFGWSPPGGSADEPASYCSQRCLRRAKAVRELARLDELDPARVERRAELERRTKEKARARALAAERAGQAAEARRIRAELAETERQRRAAPERHAENIGAQAAAARELLLPASHCSCGKVASPTKDAAKHTKRSIEKASGHSNEVRYYQCYPGGPWHWTRMDATLDGWKRRQRRRR